MREEGRGRSYVMAVKVSRTLWILKRGMSLVGMRYPWVMRTMTLAA